MLWNGNECGKNKSNENFKTTIPSKNYDRLKKLDNVESFKYLGSILTDDGRCTCEVSLRIRNGERGTGSFLCGGTEHGTFVAQKTCIRREIS